MRKYILSFLVGGMLSFSSCADYLEVSDELADDLTMEEIFNTPKYTRGWHGNIFNCISEYNKIFGVVTAFNNPWSTLSGETCSCHATTMTEPVNGYTASNASFQDRFNNLYTYIRQAYLFIENAKPLGGDADVDLITPEQIARMKSEAKFFIAYSYFSLFELYGPVPIIDHVVDDSQSSFDVPRASVDEMVNFIDGLYQEVLNENVLPRTIYYNFEDGAKHDEWQLNEIVRPTRAVVLAMRAKLWVYAASPLFNGGYPEAMALRNEDGKQLFPAKDENKWKIAKTHLEEFLKFAEEEGYELFTVKNADGSINASQSVYQLFQDYNDEIIWARGDNVMNHEQTGDQRRCRPRDIKDGFSGIGVSQQMVDAFFTKNGLGIDQDPEYNETGFTDIENPCTYKAKVTDPNRVDKHVNNMYVNREPRFYWAVTYTGKSWHIQPSNGWFFNAAYDGNNGLGKTWTSARMHYTGYLLYKRCNNTLYPTTPGILQYARPNILLRLADFYLYYAEVCNEINPKDPNIILYLDKVRKRAGIPGYQELKDNNVKDKDGNRVDIIGDYEKQAYAIRKERQVELFAEGQRYFDIHRWMICGPGEEADQSKFIGMNLNGNLTDEPGTEGSFFRRVNARNYVWTKAMYLYPIPHAEIEKSPSMIQNPLW